jgi:hypothetical protein
MGRLPRPFNISMTRYYLRSRRFSGKLLACSTLIFGTCVDKEEDYDLQPFVPGYCDSAFADLAGIPLLRGGLCLGHVCDERTRFNH